MLTFPVMLTSQCCYDPLRERFRYSNMSLMAPLAMEPLNGGQKKGSVLRVVLTSTYLEYYFLFGLIFVVSWLLCFQLEDVLFLCWCFRLKTNTRLWVATDDILMPLDMSNC